MPVFSSCNVREVSSQIRPEWSTKRSSTGSCIFSFPKIRVEVGNVFFLREMDAHQFMTIFDPQKRIPALIDAVVSVILFQRIDVFCLAVEVAEMHAVIQIDAPVGGKHHSSVG